MKPDKLTIHDLFQKERRYVVPLYQRAYVWSLQDQWEPLWDDIERQSEACLKAENHVSKRSHFLGAIVLNVSRIVGAGVARSEVIDGQQRLTTLQIFIAALRDFAVEAKSISAGALRRLTVNEDEDDGSDGSFKVWPTNADRELFRTVLTAGSPEGLRRSLALADDATAPRLAGAYLYYYRRVKEFVETAGADAEKREKRIFGLRQSLRTSLQLVVIELEDNDDPQVIFETLNARGQPLLPSDLIRNYIFLQAAKDAALNLDDLYNRYWRHFDDERVDEPISGEDRFWHVAERQGRLTRPRIDLFLFHYLTMQTETDLNIGQLFREFRDWRNENPTSNTVLLTDLTRYSDIFRRLISPVGADRPALLAKRLVSLDTSTVYPLLLYVLALPEQRLSVVSRDRMLDDLESWMVRRFVCQLTNKNYNRFFVALLSKLKNAASDVDLADLVRAELSRSRDVTARWPTQTEFCTAWLTKPIYAKSRPDRSAMLLRAIEGKMRTTKNEMIELPGRLSVEHLLPQKGELSVYPYSDPTPSLHDETAERTRERLVHTIGNLTLLTGELNSSVSNGPWGEKVAKIVSDSDLRVNAWLRTTPPAIWTEDEIIARGEELFEFAEIIWPCPVQDEAAELSDGPDEFQAKGQWQFTDRALVQKKRRALVAALSEREGKALSTVTLAKHCNHDGTFRAVVAVSKLHSDRPNSSYWYAFHPDWERYLSETKEGFFVLGCMDRAHGFAIPFADFQPLMKSLHSTTRPDTGRLHWHIHLAQLGTGLALMLPKLQTTFVLEPYRLVSEKANSDRVDA